METKISPDELADRLTDVLARVWEQGERFVVERDGERLATIVPAPPQSGITWGEFLALMRDGPRPDPGFADDLEAIQAAQSIAEFPEWPV